MPKLGNLSQATNVKGNSQKKINPWREYSGHYFETVLSKIRRNKVAHLVNGRIRFLTQQDPKLISLTITQYFPPL